MVATVIICLFFQESSISLVSSCLTPCFLWILLTSHIIPFLNCPVNVHASSTISLFSKSQLLYGVFLSIIRLQYNILGQLSKYELPKIRF